MTDVYRRKKICNMMFKTKGGGGQRLFEQCSKNCRSGGGWHPLASLHSSVCWSNEGIGNYSVKYSWPSSYRKFGQTFKLYVHPSFLTQNAKCINRRTKLGHKLIAIFLQNPQQDWLRRKTVKKVLLTFEDLGGKYACNIICCCFSKLSSCWSYDSPQK